MGVMYYTMESKKEELKLESGQAYRSVRKHTESCGEKQHEILSLEKLFSLWYTEHMGGGPNRRQEKHWKLPLGIQQRIDGIRQEMTI